MFFELRTTFHLIVSQPASTFGWLDFTAVSNHYNSVRKQMNDRPSERANRRFCVRACTYVKHPQSSKLENMLSIH